LAKEFEIFLAVGRHLGDDANPFEAVPHQPFDRERGIATAIAIGQPEGVGVEQSLGSRPTDQRDLEFLSEM
jgi:hypothetical protein